MSREFRDEVGVVARWTADGYLSMVDCELHPGRLPAFIAWLREGPRQKRWRITRTFEDRPNIVYMHHARPSVILQACDVEEVTE